MKKKIVISILSLVLTTGLILTGCSSLSVSTTSDSATESTDTSVTDASEETTDSTDTTETTTAETTTDTGELITPIESLDLTDMFSSGDLETGYDESTSTVVTLDGDSISVSGSGATADGTTLTITEEGTYIISGELTDGQILIEADESA